VKLNEMVVKGLLVGLVMLCWSTTLLANWEKIQPPVDSDARCAGIPNVPESEKFYFFVEEGDLTKLLVFFDGGGACWDARTCVGSLAAFNADPHLPPTYTPIVDETTDALNDHSQDSEAGILSGRADNPFADYTKVFVPYCTGDVHLGSGETTYNFGGVEQIVAHRGADNVHAVLDWLYDFYTTRIGKAPDEVVVSGVSAGGYAAMVHFPAIQSMLPASTDTFVLTDSANAVVTDGFLDLAFGSGPGEGNWHAWDAIPDLIKPALEGNAEETPFALVNALTQAYQGTRFGQMTAAFDAIQSKFLTVMQGVDDGTYDPFDPPTEAEILATALFEWSPRARFSMNLLALSTPWNFRYYLAAGTNHGQLVTAQGFPSGNFFSENSGGNVALRDWVDDMVNRKSVWWNTDWRNRRCTPNCLEPLLP
jgi:hypothetical protein